ncbi:hypothetical protein D7Y41_16970 [Anaerotruncus sp. 1XD22-93]|nr:hypothetical protein D7Y41_16970 [Anaerotruncus sp. 1XD22-93]
MQKSPSCRFAAIHPKKALHRRKRSALISRQEPAFGGLRSKRFAAARSAERVEGAAPRPRNFLKKIE